MADLRFRVGVKGPIETIYDAVSQPAKLAGWWATKAGGVSAVRASLDLEFPGMTVLSFTVRELLPHRLVRLGCVSGPPAWKGTELRFELRNENEQVFVTLTRANVESSDEDAVLYFGTKWPVYLLSLKDFIETGAGRPYPTDVKIHHGD